MDFELLKKRREKYLKLQRELGEEQHIGLGYVLTVEGKQYPVLSCFSVSEETEEVKEKLKYLINGRKKLTKLFQQSRWTTRPSCDMLLPYPIRFDLTEPHSARKGNV